jgi:hypothetical protein
VSRFEHPSTRIRSSAATYDGCSFEVSFWVAQPVLQLATGRAARILLPIRARAFSPLHSVRRPPDMKDSCVCVEEAATAGRQGLVLQPGLCVGLTTRRKRNKFVTKFHKGPRTWTDVWWIMARNCRINTWRSGEHGYLYLFALKNERVKIWRYVQGSRADCIPYLSVTFDSTWWIAIHVVIHQIINHVNILQLIVHYSIAVHFFFFFFFFCGRTVETSVSEVVSSIFRTRGLSFQVTLIQQKRPKPKFLHTGI